jgi:transcriptional regulator with XRE-family HTH domain
MKVREVGKFIRDQRRNASLSLRKLSTLAGVSNPYLSQIERGLRRPSAEILQAIARALSISAETLYIKAGILEERSDDVDFAGTLRRDVSISEKQKQILIDLYQSFRASPEAAHPAPAKAVARAKVASRPKASAAAKRTKAKARPNAASATKRRAKAG